MAIGLIYSPRFLDHLTGPGHPERPERLQNIVDSLKSSAQWERLEHIIPEIRDAGLPKIIHDPAYLKRVGLTCDRGDEYLDTFDNPICHDSYQVALLAANASAAAVDYVMKDAGNRAMVLPRPPGHHAEFNQAMGFCIFNNIAIAAQYARLNYGVTRVAIVDFDVHHGNGTQHLFEEDPNVLYLSLHRYPFFPGTGARNETGRGNGIGATVNYPLHQGSDDEIYLDIFNNSAADVLLRFRPELLLISAGFDAHELDPLGGMVVTTAGFGEITRTLRKIVDECCAGQVVSILEGGYNLRGLAESVAIHLKELE